MGCTISDFRDKEVINVCDGRRLGYVIDVEFDIVSGRIISIVVPGDKCGFLCFSRCEDIYIDWCKIQRIGDDTILVDIGRDVSDCDCIEDKHKRNKY